MNNIVPPGTVALRARVIIAVDVPIYIAIALLPTIHPLPVIAFLSAIAPLPIIALLPTMHAIMTTLSAADRDRLRLDLKQI